MANQRGDENHRLIAIEALQDLYDRASGLGTMRTAFLEQVALYGVTINDIVSETADHT